MFVVLLMSTISLLAVPRGVLSQACENEEKLSITTVNQGIYWVNDDKVVKDSGLRLMTHDNIVKIRVKMTEGDFNMVSSEVRTIRVIQIRWACRDSNKIILHEKTENLANVQEWQNTKIEEEFTGCSDIEVKFTKSSTVEKMGIKALTMDTCIAPTGGCYEDPVVTLGLDFLTDPAGMTNVACVNHCTVMGHAYAFTYSTESCLCGNTLKTNLVPAVCTEACPGDIHDICGHGNYVYLSITGL